jgi:uncharacterized protein (DUF1499 family)
MSDTVEASTSRVARTSAVLAAASLGTALIGIIGVQIGVLAPISGFYLFALGALLGGVISFLLGAVGLFLTNGGRDPVGARRSWLGAGGGVLMLIVVLMGIGGGGDAPPINDITTNLSNPPSYATGAEYPAEFVSIVKKAYPDLAPMRLDQSRDDAYRTALTAARALGWTITSEDPAAGTFEAQEQSTIFHFVDDIAVRIAAAGSSSVIDVRSKSRDGRGDMGVNAARIRAFAGLVAPADVAGR